jgi:phospholipid/cholesterol/gamma-HCH transport system substrate-binding protein
LHSANAEGVKERAQVLMAGVQVGTVSQVKLNEDGKGVTISLRIKQSHKIYKDALFKIEQAGFLGDHYISVHPTANAGGVFEEGGEADAKPPFDLYGAADAVLGFLADMHGAVGDVRSNLLNESTLTRLSSAISNANVISVEGVDTVRGLNSIIGSNKTPVTIVVSNLDVFSGRLNGIATEATNFIAGARDFLATNSTTVNRSLKNLESSTEKLDGLITEVRAGQGAVGELISDRELANSMSHIVTNVSLVTSNLSVTASNLNRLGLWGILWKHNPPRTNAPHAARPLTSPKNAVD